MHVANPAQLESNLKKLPAFCFAQLSLDKRMVILLKRNESGYYPDNGPFADEKMAADYVNKRNALIEVTPYQREAMVNGSLWGWDVPGADPDNEIVKLSADSKKEK